MRIVVTHGRDQAFEIPETMARAWLDALRDGLGAAGYARPDEIDVRFAFYGDLWRPDRRAQDDEDRGGAAGAAPDAPDALDEPPSAMQASVGAELLGPRPDDERLDWRRLGQVVRALDDVFGVGEVLLTQFMADLDEYFRDAAIRAAVLDRVAAACQADAGPVLLLGHSMGSIVAYDLVATRGARPLGIAGLVTFGSPLGMKSLHRHVADLHPGTPYPPDLDAWTNVYNEEDFATVVRSLADIFPGTGGHRVRDVAAQGREPSLLSPARGHDPIVYLSSMGLGRAVRELLETAEGVPANGGAVPANGGAVPANGGGQPRNGGGGPRNGGGPAGNGGGAQAPEVEPAPRASPGTGRATRHTARAKPPMAAEPPPLVPAVEPAVRAPDVPVVAPVVVPRETRARAAPPPRPRPGGDEERGGGEAAASGVAPVPVAAAPGVAPGPVAAVPAEGRPTKTVERTASADFPPVVKPGSTHDLLFAISGTAAYARAADMAFVVPAEQRTLDLRVGVYAPDFDIRVGDVDQTFQDLTINLDDPTRRVVRTFALTAHETAGRQESIIYLTVYRGTVPVSDIALQTTIDPAFEPLRASISLDLEGADDPDFVLVIMDRGNPKGAGPFDMFVSQKGEFVNRPLGTMDVTINAWKYAQDRLAGFKSVREGKTDRQRFNRAESLGLALWRDLPADFQRFYWDELHGHDWSIAIYSQEPYIPWELIRPQKESGEQADFLGISFRIARWKQAVRFPDPLVVSGFSVIAPVYTAESGARPLPGAQEEADALVAEFGATRIAGELGAVTDLLESTRGVQLIHFAGHGDFDPDAENDTVIKLADQALVPEDVYRANLGRASRPLVFLNACEVGEEGWALTRIGGWAEAFTDVGFSGFIGPYWAVNDTIARKAALLFYGALRDGSSVGRALQLIRRGFYDEPDERYRGHPSWLAYTLHCQPNVHVTMPAAANDGGLAAPVAGGEGGGQP